MTIEVKWDNDEQIIIRWNFVGRWTEQELHEAIRQSNELVEAQDHTVNHIIDFSRAEGLPPNIISGAKNAINQMPKNLGQVVVLTEGRAINVMAEALQRFSWFSNKIHLAKNDAEAKAFIEAL